MPRNKKIHRHKKVKSLENIEFEKFDITKVANLILYMLHKKVKNLNDKKLTLMMFFMEYNHMQFCNSKIFFDTYIKQKRNPEGLILSDLFDVIANEEELEDDDLRTYLIDELCEYVNIDINKKETFVELKFSVNENEEFDEELFTKDEIRTIQKIINTYSETSVRNLANETFNLDVVRNAQIDEIII